MLETNVGSGQSRARGQDFPAPSGHLIHGARKVGQGGGRLPPGQADFATLMPKPEKRPRGRSRTRLLDRECGEVVGKRQIAAG
ncbi:MAG: hypothetical protein ABL967_17170 [Bryobacteraceae bacterium]